MLNHNEGPLFTLELRKKLGLFIIILWINCDCFYSSLSCYTNKENINTCLIDWTTSCILHEILFLTMKPLSLFGWKKWIWNVKCFNSFQNIFLIELFCHILHHYYFGREFMSNFSRKFKEFFRIILPLIINHLEPIPIKILLKILYMCIFCPKLKAVWKMLQLFQSYILFLSECFVMI